MPRQIAALAFLLGIWGLFALARDRKARTSGALWLPVIWLALAASRSVTEWMAIFGFGGAAFIRAGQYYAEGSPLDRNVYLALTVFALIVLFRRHERIGMLLRSNAPILLYFAYCAVSIAWSDYPDVTFKRWVKAIGDLVMVLIVLTEVDPLAAIKRLFTRVGFVLLPISILFMKYYPEWGRDYHRQIGLWTTSYTGVTANKNLLGTITLIFGLASWWHFLQLWQRRKRERNSKLLMAHGIFLAMVAWLFWMVNSATAMSCFIIGAGLIAATSLYKRIGRKPAVVHILVLVVLLIPLYALFGPSAGDLLGAVGRDPTLTGRTDIWKLALSMRGYALLGRGFESFWLGWRLLKVQDIYAFQLQEAHNGYLEVYLNLGWIGVSLLAGLLVTGYRNVMTAFRSNSETASLRLAFFVVALVYNLTEAAFKTQNPVWIVFLLVTMTVPSMSTRPSPASQLGTHDRAESKPQVADVFVAGLRQEAV
ncbi:MAG: hypothetical protein LAN63_14585 [Acidobacteriia bacterium]|nr:hypothetical protein [Terriglobia bacterium]